MARVQGRQPLRSARAGHRARQTRRRIYGHGGRRRRPRAGAGGCDHGSQYLSDGLPPADGRYWGIEVPASGFLGGTGNAMASEGTDAGIARSRSKQSTAGSFRTSTTCAPGGEVAEFVERYNQGLGASRSSDIRTPTRSARGVRATPGRVVVNGVSKEHGCGTPSAPRVPASLPGATTTDRRASGSVAGQAAPQGRILLSASPFAEELPRRPTAEVAPAQ